MFHLPSQVVANKAFGELSRSIVHQIKAWINLKRLLLSEQFSIYLSLFTLEIENIKDQLEEISIEYIDVVSIYVYYYYMRYLHTRG